MRAPIIVLVATVLAACTAIQLTPEARHAEDLLFASFPKLDPSLAGRLETDEAQRVCSAARNDAAQIEPAVLARIGESQQAAIRYPANGQLLGDWREGEKLAQSGYGLRTGDDPKRGIGGNCYACHQGAAKELSYGTLGPSLKEYGKLRGNGEAIQKYAYDKIYNPQALTPCSTMPRFGHHGVLTPEQITHLVAWLLDPQSPVNGR